MLWFAFTLIVVCAICAWFGWFLGQMEEGEN
jgi:hypothetical protein